jgi:hypothetical protein
VALIGDRPVLGGNASSEVRVSIKGNINLPPYPAIGVVVGELEPYHGDRTNHWSGDKAMDVVRAEKNIQLFLNTRVFAVEKQGNKISAVVARNVATSRELRFRAPLFADCTGDADVGYLAGADYHYGRESRSETGEPWAPDAADHLVMGMTIHWFSEDAGKAVPFPETPWGPAFNEKTVQNATQSTWDWEVTGLHWNQIDEFETVRDNAFRAIYGKPAAALGGIRRRQARIAPPVGRCRARPAGHRDPARISGCGRAGHMVNRPALSGREERSGIPR